MASILPWMHELDNFADSLADAQTTSWPLMSSLSTMIFVILSYIFVVLSLGPKLMENRKPFNLKRIIIIYNTFQVIACTILFTWILQSKPTFGCAPLKRIVSEETTTTAKICWWTTLLKLAELIETVFFVLRKKQNQVSALHVYHHASTLAFCWCATKVFPSKMVLPIIMINCFVHTLMYTYYLLSSIGPTVQQKIDKWKKYITIIQMIQFCILSAFTLQMISPTCDVPSSYAYIFIPNVFLVFYMFYQFYKAAYLQRIQKSD